MNDIAERPGDWMRNRNASGDGEHDAKAGLPKSNTYNEGSASWRAYERAYEQAKANLDR